MVFLYNLVPLHGDDEKSAPSLTIFNYLWRYPIKEAAPVHRREVGGYRVGDEVFAKPEGARCTTHWRRARVTAVTPAGEVEVNGVHRRPSEIRHCTDEWDREHEDADSSSSASENETSSDVSFDSSPIAI